MVLVVIGLCIPTVCSLAFLHALFRETETARQDKSSSHKGPVTQSPHSVRYTLERRLRHDDSSLKPEGDDTGDVGRALWRLLGFPVSGI